MKFRVLMYAGAMLITGSINTIAVKFQDMSVVGKGPDGAVLLFQHPAFQSACMFLGESLCLLPYFLLRWRRRYVKKQQGIASKPKPPRSFYIRRTMAFAIPTLCDATATTLLNIGLFYTFASTYQMLRGTLVLFTGLFTILVLKRTLYLHHWLGMVLIMAGAAIVGAASIFCPNTPSNPTQAPPPGHHGFEGGMSAAALNTGGPSTGMLGGMMQLHWPGLYAHGSGEEGFRSKPSLCAALPPGSRGPLFGNAMVILAQGFTALQFILEEKFLGTYRMQPLLAVGIEGAWGVVLCLAALPMLSLIKTHDGRPLDDAPAAFKALWEVPSVRYAVLTSIMSIGLFNFFGLSVTAALSGASRATIDACRTVLIWAFSLVAGWESFKQLQVVGFLVLLSGTSLYNELLRSCLPHPSRGSRADGDSSDEDDDGEGSACSENAVQGPFMDEVEEGDEESGVLVPGGEANGVERTNSRSLDAEGGLQEPLIRAPSQSRAHPPLPPGAPRQPSRAKHSHSQRITVQGGAHHQSGHFTMARSMRLGFNALSPHDLGDDDDDSVMAAESQDVADPMMLAQTPYFAPGGLRGMMSDNVSSTSGASPRQSISELDEPQQFRTSISFSAARPGPGQVPSGPVPAFGPPGLYTAPPGAFPVAPNPFVVAPVAPGPFPPRPAAPAAAGRGRGGGFLAFMAAREQEKQQEPPGAPQ